jgi:hypothetical protein
LSDDTIDTTFFINDISASGGETMTFNIIFNGETGIGIPSVASLDLVTVYPNPSNGNFTVDFATLTGQYHLVVQDIRGVVVYQEKAEISGSRELNLDLATGIYILKINSEKGMLVRKIVVND